MHPEGRDLAAPKIIEELIDRFYSGLDFYRSSQYNETELTQFINLFFEAFAMITASINPFNLSKEALLHA
jgi:hypothetical protein